MGVSPDDAVLAVYKNEAAATVQAVFGLVGAAVVCWPTITAMQATPQRMSTATGILFLVVGVAVGAFGVRGALSRVVVTHEGLLVVNPVRRHWSSRTDIEHFSLGRWGVLPRVGIVELRDGARVGMWALAARNPAVSPKDPEVDAMVDLLNRWLAEGTTRPTP